MTGGPGTGAGRWLWRALAAAAVALPALPLGGYANPKQDAGDWLPHVRAWPIGLVTVVILGLIVGRFAARRGSFARRRSQIADGPADPSLVVQRSGRPRWSAQAEWRAVLLLAVAFTAAAAVTSWVVFAANPHLVDEMAQLLHARAFTAGRLALPAPEPAAAFLTIHTWIVDGGWASQYPPGHTALLAAGLLVGAEWLVGPVLGGVSLVLVYLVARGLYGRRVALVAGVLWAISAWVLFMSASYMNHVGAAALALACWALVFGPRAPRPVHLVLAGLALAAAAATRPLDAVAAGVPVLVWIVQGRRWQAMPWLAAGGAAVGVVWAWFNWRVFGAPLAMGYSVLYGTEQSLGFHTDPWGEPFTPFVALANLTVALRRLHVYLFEWPIPALAPLVVWAACGKIRRRDAIVAAGLVALPALYFFYWHSGYFLGPRFYYPIAPLLVIGTARAWCWGVAAARRAKGRWVRWDAALAGTAAAVLVWGWLGVLPARITQYRGWLPTFKLHPERELRARGVERALVLVRTSWANRLVTDLWAMGVKPGVVERAYRELDTCELDRERRRAHLAALPGDEIAARLERLTASVTTPAIEIADWPDPHVKLAPGATVTAPCRVEMARDLRGFTTYANVAWRNPVGLDRGIVFARDLFERNDELLARYPGWEVWLYTPPPGELDAPPVLTRLRPAADR